MCEVLVRNGFQVVMLEEVPGISSPDILLNGVKAELKYTNSAKNLYKHANKAIQKQGAEIVVVRFENSNKETYQELADLKRKKGHTVYFYFEGEGVIRVL